MYFVTDKGITAQHNSKVIVLFSCLQADVVMDAVVQYLDSEYFVVVWGKAPFDKKNVKRRCR